MANFVSLILVWEYILIVKRKFDCVNTVGRKKIQAALAGRVFHQNGPASLKPSIVLD